MARSNEGKSKQLTGLFKWPAGFHACNPPSPHPQQFHEPNLVDPHPPFGSREPGKGHESGIPLSTCWSGGREGCGGVRELGPVLIMSDESAANNGTPLSPRGDINLHSTEYSVHLRTNRKPFPAPPEESAPPE
ncbi:hypothetical protein L209DRAFT_560252 [Thermothelomyces heterothallicus CBS 203.75]